jgi:hypothetical protein
MGRDSRRSPDAPALALAIGCRYARAPLAQLILKVETAAPLRLRRHRAITEGYFGHFTPMLTDVKKPVTISSLRFLECEPCV